MLEEKDLQAIAEIMDSRIGESEKRMAQLIDQKLEPIKSDISGIKTRLDVEVKGQFNLLAEGQQAIMSSITPKSEIEELRNEVSVLKLAIRTMNQELAELKKAQ